MTTLSGFRWRDGHHDAADVTEAYAIESFPAQTDMRGAVRWIRPQSESEIVQPAARPISLGGDSRAYGGYVLSWVLPLVTPDMMSWLWTNKMSSSYSNNATIRTWHRINDEWLVLQCIAHWPTLDEINGLERGLGGFVDFPITFILGENAP